MKDTAAGILYALLAALLYGASSPFSKLLLGGVPPALLAALLYLGAGAGTAALLLLRAFRHRETAAGEHLAAADVPTLTGMVALDIAAAVLLMFGLQLSPAADVSLLSNFEIAATALIAMLLFREPIGRRLWAAIALITFSCLLLSLGGAGSPAFLKPAFSPGAALVPAACVCWGFENNLSRRVSSRDPLEVVAVKGFGSGLGAAGLALLLGERLTAAPAFLPAALLLGFVSYGLSICCYLLAQRALGAARTSAFYAASPFFGVAVSFALFREAPGAFFAAALPLMALGAFFACGERHRHTHTHPAVTHAHWHCHLFGLHAQNHTHEGFVLLHCHEHTHGAVTHTHAHTMGLHHLRAG